MKAKAGARVRAGAALLGFAASAGAAELEWRTTVESSGPVPSAIRDYVSAMPEADGGYALSFRNSAGGWLVRFDRDDRIVERTRVARSGRLLDLGNGAVTVLDGQFEYPEVPLDYVCRVEPTARGPQIAHATYYFDAGPFGLDGFLEHGSNYRDDPTTTLYWFRQDCRVEPAPAHGLASITRIVPDRETSAAYVLGTSASTGGRTIVRVTRDRVEWNFGLDGFPLDVRAVGADGVYVLVVMPEPTPGARLDRLSRDGRRLWSRAVERGAIRLARRDIVLVEEHGEARSSLRAFAPDGSVRWTRANVKGYPLPSLPEGDRLYLHSSGDAAVYEVALADGSARSRRVSALVTPLAILADGSLIAQHGHRYLDDSLPRLERWLPDASAPHPVASDGGVPEAIGASVLVAVPGGGAYVVDVHGYGIGRSLSRIDRDGRRIWRRAIEPTLGFDTSMRYAATAERFCRLRELPDESRRLECYDARDGAALTPLALPRGGTSARLVAVEEDVHVLDTPVERGQLPRALVRTIVGRDGRPRNERVIAFEGNASYRTAPSGAFTLFERFVARERVRYFAASGEERWAIDLATLGAVSGSQLLGVVPAAASALVGFAAPDGTSTLVRLDGAGRSTWRARFERDTEWARIGDDWIVFERSGFDDANVTMHRLADRDGATQFRIAERWLRRGGFVVAPTGDAFLIPEPFGSEPWVYGRPAGDAWWYDGRTGRRVGAIAALRDAADYGGAPIHRFDAEGGLLRATSTVEGPRAELALERYRARDAATRPRTLRQHAAGRWIGAALNGQSIELAVDRTGAVDGRWLTFSHDGANDPAQQRWYRLAGNFAAGAAPDALLAILAPEPGRFDRGAPRYRTAGRATWHQLGCERAELEFRFEGELDDVAGRIVLERGDRFDCETLRRRLVPDSAVWRTADGRSLMLHVDASGDITGAWPTFEPRAADGGAPQWLALETGADGTIAITRTLGGRFETGPTGNRWRIGGATLERTSCARTRLAYRFDAGELAEPFDTQQGVLELSRAGGCPR